MSNILEEFDGTVDNRINDKTADYSIAKQDVGNTIKEGIALASLIPVANVDLIYPKDWITRDVSYNVFISLQNNVNGDTAITQNWQPISGASGTSVYSLEANGFANAYTSTNDSIEEYLDNVIYIISPDEANTDSATYEINALGALPIKKLASGTLSNLDSGDLAVAGYYALVWRDSYFYVIAGIETRVNNGLESVNGVIGLGGELVRNTTIDGAENELNVSNLSYASLGFVSGLDTALFQLAPNLFSYDYENSDSTEIIQFYPNVNQFYFYGQTSDYSVSLYNQPNNLFISSSDLINNNSQTIYQTFNGINIHSSNNLGDNNQIYNTSGYATINGSEGDLSHQAQVYSDANTGITLFSGTTDKSDDFISIEANKNSVVITNFTDDAKLETPELQLTGTIANDDTLTKVAVFDNSGNVQYREASSLVTSISGVILHGTASGTDTYTVTIPTVTSYSDGVAYLIRFTNGNTTAATLNINSLGAKSLFRNNDGALIGGDIVDGAEMLCVYNSTADNFQVIGTAPNSLIAYVTNADSVTLTKGMAVYAFGGTGDRMTVKRAQNTGDATSAQTIGLVLSDSIGANQKGLIMMQGLLDGLSILPTSTFADGDPIYLGSSAGSITKTKPYAPNHLVYLGVVTTASNGSAGRMYVKVQNGYELDELHNVQAQSPSLKDTLWYDNSVSPAQWKTASIATILGYTPEDVANKSTDGTFALNSDTLYPSQKAAKTYVDTGDKKFEDVVSYVNGQVDQAVYFDDACSVTKIYIETTISTLQYNVNGGLFTLVNIATVNAGTPISISAASLVVWRITYVTPTPTSSGVLFYKATKS